MTPAVDSGVLIAAFASWHADHTAAVEVLATKPRVPAHAQLEAYSVLTRLPGPQRASGALVAEFLARNFPDQPWVLPAEQAAALIPALSRLSISGGAVYDGLIAMTVLHHGGYLYSLDHRAKATYERCGVSFELLPVAGDA